MWPGLSSGQTYTAGWARGSRPVGHQLGVRDAVAVLGGHLADHADPARAHGVDAVHRVAQGALGERVLPQRTALRGQARDRPVVLFEPLPDPVPVELRHATSLRYSAESVKSL